MLGQRVRRLIAQSCDAVAFYVAEPNFAEAERYLAQLGLKRGIEESVWRAALESLLLAVQLVGHEELALVQEQAQARISQRDPRDWPAVAAALLLDCPIWTEDRDFFGAGVATWTTDTVELYLHGD